MAVVTPLGLAGRRCKAGLWSVPGPAFGRSTRFGGVLQPAGRTPSLQPQPALLCRCEAPFAGQSDRSSSPSSTSSHWQHHQWGQNRPALPPESSVPSTSGRSHLPPQPHGSHEPCHNNVSHDAYGYEETWDLPDDGFTPFPGNLPTGTGSEDPPPHQLFKSSRMYFGVQSSNERWRYLSQVWVLLFGVGTRETEGIYSLRAMSRETGVPQDTIIAFEDAEDAERYAGLLEATMEHVPHVSPINVQELLDFCEDSGYKCRLEPRGTLLLPPDYNIGMTDWERSLRLRKGRYSVLDSEPEPSAPANPGDAPAEDVICVDDTAPTLHNNAVGPPPTDIEDWRARLERQWQ